MDPKQADGPINLKSADGADPSEAAFTQEAFVKKHMSRFDKWADNRRLYEVVWADIYALFFSRGKESNLPTRSKIVLPLVFQIIEAAVPKLVTVIFGQPEWFRAKSRSSQSPIPQAVLDAHEELYRYQLKLSDYFVKFVDFFKGMFMYGTAYLMVYWKVKREWVYTKTATRSDQTAFGSVIQANALTWEKKLEYVVTERRPEIDVIPIEDIYPDPDARTEQESTGFYHTSSIHIDKLKELSSGPFPVYGNFDQVKLLSGDSSKYEDQAFKKDKRTLRGVGELNKDSRKEQIDLHTFWGLEDIDGDGIMEEVQLVFANKKVLIRAIRNPFDHQKRPLIRGVLFPVPHEWFGMGLIEPVIGLINELVTIRRQNLDMNALILNRMWKVHSMADIDLDTIVTSPNGIILTGDMDGIEALDQPPIPVSPLQMSELIQNDIESATAPKSIQGAPGNGALGRTAKGAQLIISQALEKFGMSAKLIEEQVITKVMWFFKKLNEQFLDQDSVIQEFYGHIGSPALTPEQIHDDLDFELLGISETVTKEATINQLISIYNLLVSNPTLDVTPIAFEVIRLAGVNIDPKTLIRQQPPMPAPGAQPPDAGQTLQNGASAPMQVPQQ
jgi:hypothetical protein